MKKKLKSGEMCSIGSCCELFKFSSFKDHSILSVIAIFPRYEQIDNACDSLYDLSLRSWGEFHDCEGNRYNNLKDGYCSLLNVLVQDIPESLLHLNCPVIEITWKPAVTLNTKHTATKEPRKDLAQEKFISVTYQGGLSIQASHAIVTPSLGFLQEHIKDFFTPPLPSKFSRVSC